MTAAEPDIPNPDATARAKATAAYAQQSRHELEEKLILDYLPLVRHIVQKVCAQMSRRVDTEDLISAGTMGLVQAARNYDASHNAEFKTYAYIRIRGAVIDELRSLSFAPVSVRAQVRKMQEAYRRLSSGNGTPPSDGELAAECGMSVEQILGVMEEARNQHFLSLHALVQEDGGSVLLPDSSPAPDEQAQRRELLEVLAQAIGELPQRERMVVLLYYERDLTMKETAVVMGVSEPRVSQLHAAAVFRLSTKLKERL